MSVETAQYPTQLNTALPAASDWVSEGDDHIRLVKTVLKTTFPNVSGAVSASHTQLNYLSGVTSPIQPQIDGKGAISGQTWTGTHVFPSTTTIGPLTPTIQGYLQGLTSDAQAQINSKGSITGQVWTGTHNFTGATVSVPTVAVGDSSNAAASTAFVAATAFSAALPSQAGNAGKLLTTDGSTASWSGSAFVASLNGMAGDVKWGDNTFLPVLRPTLLIDFANSRSVDPRITFTRSSTAKRINERGQIETVAANVPRIDFDPVTLACKGLLIEEARTNICLWSEDFTKSQWVKSGGIIDAGPTLRGFSFQKFVESAATEDHQVDQAISIATGVSYALSIYVMAAGRDRVRIAGRSEPNWSEYPSAVVNLTAGTVESSTGSRQATTKSIGGGVHRITIYGKTAAGNTGIVVQPLPSTGASKNYTGDGTSGIYISCAQVEEGSFPTSHIRTTSAAATRAADTASMSGTNFSEWYRQDEGTFVVDAIFGLDLVSSAIISANSSSTSNAIEIIAASPGGAGPYGYVNTGGVTQASMTDGNALANTAYRAAIAYKADDYAFSRDGRVAVTDASGTVPTVERLDIGARAAFTYMFNGHIRSIAFYPKRLSNAELQALTAP